MKRSDRISSFLNGAGFYIVLLLSLAMIGIAGYSIYHAITTEEAAAPLAEQLNVLSDTLTEEEEPEPAAAPPAPAQPTEPDTETAPVSATVAVPEPKPPKEAKSPAPIVLPLEGKIITPYSMEELLFNETMGDWRTHDGIDIAAEEGAPIAAAAAGQITSVVEDYWLGVTVTLLTEEGCELRYSCLQAEPDAAAGDHVNAGDPIGAVGSTALLEADLGPHLHFSVSKNGESIDPARYLPALK